jgi:gas vesicle protein
MNTNSKVMLGIAAGAVVGIAIGMLLAPEKGNELQKKIKTSANDWVTKIAALLTSGGDLVEDVSALAENKFEEMSPEGASRRNRKDNNSTF